MKPANTSAPKSLYNASAADQGAFKNNTISIKATHSGFHTASNTERIHANTSFVQSKTPDATPVAQKDEPVSRENHTPRPEENLVSSKSPCTMASNEMRGTEPKFSSIQQSIHATSPSKTSASGNTPMPRTVESTTPTNLTLIKTSEPTKSPSSGIVKELPGPKPKPASIEDSIHAVAGWTSSENQPSMSMPGFSQRPDPNANRSERSSVYSTPPNLQKKDGSIRFSGLTSSRYATPGK